MPTWGIIALVVMGAVTIAMGICWRRQVRRDRELLREHTRTVLGFVVAVIAHRYGLKHLPYIAKWLAEYCRVKAKITSKWAKHYAAMVEVLQLEFGLTFDPEVGVFHAPGPPRKPKEEDSDEPETVPDN